MLSIKQTSNNYSLVKKSDGKPFHLTIPSKFSSKQICEFFKIIYPKFNFFFQIAGMIVAGIIRCRNSRCRKRFAGIIFAESIIAGNVLPETETPSPIFTTFTI